LGLEDLKKSLLNIDDFSAQNQETTASASHQTDSVEPEQTSQPGTIQNKNIDSQILNNFMHLDQELKDIILNNSNSFRDNFDQNTVKILNNFLANNNIDGTAEKISLLKALSFLENNNLPLTESLIKETSILFKKNIIQYNDNLNNKNQLFANLNNFIEIISRYHFH